MTLSKTTLTISSLVVAMMFGGGAYVMMHLGTLAKPTAERIASEVLGVRVTIGTMDITLSTKTVSVSDIRIANPNGFSNPYAMTIKRASATLGSVSQDLVDMDTLSFNGTDVFLEVTQSGTNLQAIQNNLPARNQIASGTAAETTGETASTKFMIDLLSITQAKLNPSVTLLNTQALEPVVIRDILLSDIGKAEGGVPAERIIAGVIPHVIEAVNDKAFQEGFYKGLSPDALKEIGVNQVEQIKNKITDEVNKVGDALKKMFE